MGSESVVEHVTCGVRVELDDGADSNVAPDWRIGAFALAGAVGSAVRGQVS
ncbi:MAG: hypothetical protein KF678_08000 [Phycisphaeraceae bacterium]|nr:hypothetical protein [Phycisphaeraceae bacterium]